MSFVLCNILGYIHTVNQETVHRVGVSLCLSGIQFSESSSREALSQTNRLTPTVELSLMLRTREILDTPLRWHVSTSETLRLCVRLVEGRLGERKGEEGEEQ